MNYLPIPVALLEIGKPLPVDVYSGNGYLLLKKGQPVASEAHREKLMAHNASTLAHEGMAWQRAYERMVHTMLHDGVDVQTIAKASMPSDINERDYAVAEEVQGGWLDLQAVLRGVLYQGGLAAHTVQRLMSVERKVQELLHADPDDSLFCLFQALSDNTLGYSATHALLCAAIADLTASALRLGTSQRQSLMRAAFTMNIGMAREQDSLARQTNPPFEWQRALIAEHPQRSVAILQSLGVDDADELDIVRWHHEPAHAQGLSHNLLSRRILAMTDAFVAKTASRKTREGITPLGATQAMYLSAQGDPVEVASAMAHVLGFYPPGTYVLLRTGEVAVAVQRRAKATTPWVIPVVDRSGMPLASYHCRDTSDPVYAITAPVSFHKMRVTIALDKVRRARERLVR